MSTIDVSYPIGNSRDIFGFWKKISIKYHQLMQMVR